VIINKVLKLSIDDLSDKKVFLSGFILAIVRSLLKLLDFEIFYKTFTQSKLHE